MRDTLCKNTVVLQHAVEELGYRVCIDTLQVHIESFYELCHVAIGYLFQILFIQWLNFKLFSWLGSRARAPSVSVLEPIKGARARARTQPRKKFKLFPIRTLAELEIVFQMQ